MQRLKAVMDTPRSRKSYTAQFKLKAIAYAKEHGNRATEREFGISEKLVRDWRKSKETLMTMSRKKKANRGLKARWPELEERLMKFVIEQRLQGRGMSTVQVRLKAIDIAKELNIDEFKGGASWCYRFMVRNKLSMRSRTTMCQKLPADHIEKIQNFREFVALQIQENTIIADSIVNMDEVPLTFDIPMGRTVNQIGERSISIRTTGHEKSHFTVVLGCCASGKKLPPMLIFKRKTMPREKFPPNVIIKYNAKRWMDEEMMTTWLEQCFTKRPGGFFKKK